MGHAIECRINCEDPKNNFLPSCGTVTVLQEPTNEYSDVRIDTGFVEGDEITSYYDPLLSKIIAHGKTREEAIEKMQRALLEYQVLGVPTNINFHKRILANKAFLSGEYDTGFIVDEAEDLFKPKTDLSEKRMGNIAVTKAYLETLKYRINRETECDPWMKRDQFRVNHNSPRHLVLT